jgi:hypothetical protein
VASASIRKGVSLRKFDRGVSSLENGLEAMSLDALDKSQHQ